MRKRMYIYAYTESNLGDDLLVKVLCDRYPNANFYITCDHRAAAAWKHIPNLRVLHPIPLVDGFLRRAHVPFRVNTMIEHLAATLCHGVVNIGGSIFMQKADWVEAQEGYRDRMTTGRPSFTIGANFGPYRDVAYLEGYRQLFSRTTDVCFRDKYSYQLLSDLSNVRYAADIAFAYKGEVAPRIEGRGVAISVIDLKRREDLADYAEAYERKLLDLARHFALADYSVVLMGFCESEGDHAVIRDMLERLDSAPGALDIKPYFYAGDIEEAVSLIRGSRYVVATRFHSIILGWIFKKTVFPFVYGEKTSNVLNDLGYMGPVARVQDAALVSAQDCLDFLENSAPVDISSQVRSAEDQFKVLDGFLAIERAVV